jgi:hypothetical protein
MTFIALSPSGFRRRAERPGGPSRSSACPSPKTSNGEWQNRHVKRAIPKIGPKRSKLDEQEEKPTG